MKFNRYVFGLSLGISLLGSSLHAQQQPASAPITATVPRLVNFSGKAADAQGKAIAGIAGVTLAIYKEQYEGAPLWLETQNIQADTKGNYTVQLGATKPDGLPLDLFSSGDARWLAVTVNGGQEQPRVLLLSVPYALKAADAETIGGLPPSAFVLANKTQGPGTSTKTPSPASGAAPKTAPPPVNPAVTGKGVLDFVPMWDSTSDIVNSLIFQKSSAIGVGTTSPAATLDVNGKGDVRDTLTLFPKGTDSTLAVNGTNFKVDQTGKVTFISGQTFPGAGTVTSVGLSAPSTDFTVSGSPVTKSGTLKFAWTVPPTNANTADAIVKRDSLGGFSAGAITGTLGVTGLSAGTAAVTGTNSSSGYGVYGTSTAGTGVFGQSSGTSGTSNGVEGITSSGAAAGVAGVNTSNDVNSTGIYGYSPSYGIIGSSPGVGVRGYSSATSGAGHAVEGVTFGNNVGFYTDSNVQQARTMGGWVKGMVLVNGTTGTVIERCFNSALTGAAATTPPCGFGLTQGLPGVYLVDFGFEVDDRFYSATLYGWSIVNSNPAPAIFAQPSSANQVVVSTWDGSQNVQFDFYLVVF